MKLVYKKDLYKLGLLSTKYTLNGIYKINNNKYLYSLNCYLIYITDKELKCFLNPKDFIYPFNLRRYYKVNSINHFINNINYMVLNDILKKLKEQEYNIKLPQKILRDNKNDIPYKLSKFDLTKEIDLIETLLSNYIDGKFKLLNKKYIYKFIKSNTKNHKLIFSLISSIDIGV